MKNAPFYYHPRMLSYDFGAQHPLRPERLRKTVQLLESFGIEPIDPGEGLEDDALRVHSPEYIEAIKRAERDDPRQTLKFGLGTGDTPVFPNIWQASLAYMGGSAAAGRSVRDGAPLAFNLSGGLHHAQRGTASGFCVLNDCAVAISILRERFARVAYVDIDVHHGDGVQALFYDDPTVLTCSIHQDGRTLYPGTGFVDETGAEKSSVNVPLPPETTGDVWLYAFRSIILPAIERFRPEAVVLQMGADSHSSDPLARIRNTVQDWLAVVIDINNFDLPIVAVGGGGYNVGNVIRMWTAATLALMGRVVPERLPEPFAKDWDIPGFFDPLPPHSYGHVQAEAVENWWAKHSKD